jgi:hypothetical protein
MADSGPSYPSRRRLLSSLGSMAGVAALAGCSLVWDQTGATDVIVHNAATEAKTISVTIRAEGADDPRTDRTVSLDAGETRNPLDPAKIPTNAAYTVAVDVENGPSETFDWSDPDVARAPLWILVDDSENITFLLQAG